MTKAQLIIDLQNLIGPGIEVDVNGLTTWVNDSYLQIVDAITEVNPDYFAKSATADTYDGRQEYELPDDFERAVMVTITLGGVTQRALPIPLINDIPVYGGADPNQGFTVDRPGYDIIGGNIGFVPIPDETTQALVRLHACGADW